MSFMRNIAELKENPISIAIYGENEDVSDLVESIGRSGVLSPLLVKDDGTIVSGPRRYRAAKQIGLEAVPCELVKFESPEEEEIVVISSNKTRQKTTTQIMAEADRMRIALAALAKKRQQASLKQNSKSIDGVNQTVPPNLGGTDGASHSNRILVETTTIISDALGLSRSTFNRLDFVNRAAKAGNPVAVEALLKLDKGDITVNNAYETVRKSIKKNEKKAAGTEEFVEDERIANARVYERQLYDILRSVSESGDMKSAAMWLVFLEEMKGLSDVAEALKGKAGQQVGEEIKKLKSEGRTKIVMDESKSGNRR